MGEPVETNGGHLTNGISVIDRESELCERDGSDTGHHEPHLEHVEQNEVLNSEDNDSGTKCGHSVTSNDVSRTLAEDEDETKIINLESKQNGRAPPLVPAVDAAEVHLNNDDENSEVTETNIEKQIETHHSTNRKADEQTPNVPDNEVSQKSIVDEQTAGCSTDGELPQTTLVSKQSVPAVRPKDLSTFKLSKEEKTNGGEWRDRADPQGSLPLHGTVIREGDMVSFIADNLEEKIRQSFSPTNQKYSASSPLGSSRRVQQLTKDESTIPIIDPLVVEDLEKQAKKIADNLDLMMGNLKGTLHNMSAISVGYIQTHRDSVNGMGEAVDNTVKSMYTLIAKCEELNKNMQPIYQLSRQIKEIKRRLDFLETVFK